MGSAGSGRSGRIALYLLVLNLLVLAGGLGMQYVMANRMPDIREINPGKIRFWSQPEPYKPAADTNAVTDTETPAVGGGAPADAQPAAETASSADAQATAVAARQEQATANQVCILVDNLTQPRYQEMQAVLKANGAGDGKCSYGFDKSLAWWVYWPPEYEGSRRSDALEKIHNAGVKDVFPITQGVMAQAYSLGAFKSEGQARLYCDRLRGKGLDKVEYGPRPSAGQVRLNCELEDGTQMQKLKAALPAWAKEGAAESCRVP